MVKKSSFKDQMRNNPQKIPFAKMCGYLAKIAVRKVSKRGGSHRIYQYGKHLINIQPDKSEPQYCKEYQVKQILNYINEEIGE